MIVDQKNSMSQFNKWKKKMLLKPRKRNKKNQVVQAVKATVVVQMEMTIKKRD